MSMGKPWQRGETCVPREFDLHSATIFANPYPLYHKIRSQYPVHLDSHLGCWVVTSYANVLAALANRDLSSERIIQGSLLQEKDWAALSPLFTSLSNLMFYSDPPKHTRIRSLINKAFSARMIEKWREYIQQVVDEQLALVQDQGQMDVIQDLAFPLPSRVIATMLGIPDCDYQQFKLWSDDLADFLGNPPTLEQCQKLASSIQAFMHYFRGIVAEHRKHPQNDLVDALLASENQEMTLTEDELLINCIGLFVGGHETTTNAIGNGLLALLGHADQMHKLQGDFSLLASAVDELLRFDSPVQFTARIALKTTEIGGEKIYRGQRVLLVLGAANRDPAYFQNPDDLDICRTNNRHLAFGQNIHYCIGGPLARQEIQIAIETLLRRFPHIRRAGDELVWQENLSFHGVKALPVLF
jgi:pimeloyl-[acyl-carrier protein] synthase